MCSDHEDENLSPLEAELRASGGAVAVIHPLATSSRKHSPPVSCKIYLQCQQNNTRLTCAFFKAGNPDLGGLDTLTKLQVYVHRDGDLQRSGELDSNGAMLQFDVAGESSSRDGIRGSHYLIQTPVREVNIGPADQTNAANTGIIGRRVSLVDDGEVVGDGVFGWN